MSESSPAPGRARAVLVWLALTTALAGCYRGAGRPVDMKALGNDRDWVVLEVPQVLQVGERDCGAAAAAVLLGYWGMPTEQGAIRAASGEPPDQALSAGFLRAYLRSRGLEVFLVEGTVADLEKELGARHPVMAGVVKDYLTKSYAHYVIVTGVDRAAKRVAVFDPADGFREYPVDGFLAEWSGAKMLMIVASPAAAAAKGAPARPGQQ